MLKVWRFLSLAAALTLVAVIGSVNGQSAKKDLTGPEMSMGGMKSKASQRWKAEKAEKPELYRFSLPKSGSDKEDGLLTVIPDESKKSDDELIAEFKKLIKAPEGKSVDDVVKVQKVKIGTASVAYLEASTKVTYVGGDSPGDTKEDYRIYAAALQTPNGKFIVKAVGPYNTMTFHKIDFKAWLGNLK
ncbi:MAG: hypothetical protein AB7K24_10910 [Gemmataceae bacterium]